MGKCVITVLLILFCALVPSQRPQLSAASTLVAHQFPSSPQQRLSHDESRRLGAQRSSQNRSLNEKRHASNLSCNNHGRGKSHTQNEAWRKPSSTSMSLGTKGQKSLLSKSWHSLTLDQLGIFMILPFSHGWNKHRPIQPQSWVSDLTDESEAITLGLPFSLCSFLVQSWLLNWRFLLGIVSAQKSCSFLLTSVPNFIGNLTNFQKGPSDIQLAMTFATSKTLGTCCPVFHVLPPMFGMLVCLSLQLWYESCVNL